VYYFTRRVPADLKHHYSTNRIVMTLRTRLRTVALKRARKIAEQLDRFWEKLRWDRDDVPGKQYLKDGRDRDQTQTISVVTAADQTVDHPTLLDAKSTYARLKGAGKNKQFHQTTDRAVSYAIGILGDKKLSEYRKVDATKLRDKLFERDMAPGTVRRMIAVVRSVFNFVATEQGLDITNPFVNLYLGENKVVKKRKPIPEKTRLHIQRQCVILNDEARWLVALISDTGMRLSEAAGLHANDIVLDDDIPHIIVRPHKWRRLKNAGSERKIPLVGAALWASCQIKSKHKIYAFPRYCDGETTKSNSASAALNKWINSVDKGHHVIHGFRHAMRDRLRAIECPSDVIDQIGGWTTAGVGQTYGQGYPLSVLRKWMDQL
jgi:integrase